MLFSFKAICLYLELSCIMAELRDSYFSRVVFPIYGKAKYKAFFFNLLGTLEDWDAAVQKTENRLARVNEQRAKVRILNYISS